LGIILEKKREFSYAPYNFFFLGVKPMTKGYVLFVLLLNAFVCRLGNAAAASTEDANTCWYNMKTSTVSFSNDAARKKSIVKYDECNKKHIKNFQNLIKNKSLSFHEKCDTLYKHIMKTDIYWITRKFVGDVLTNKDGIQSYQKFQTVKEYIVSQLFEVCQQIYKIDLPSNPENIGEIYNQLLRDPYALMIDLSPCMEYEISDAFNTQPPISKRYQRYSYFYVKTLGSYGANPTINDTYEYLFGHLNTLNPQNINYQSLYNFLDHSPLWNANWDNYNEKCIINESSIALYSKLQKIEKKVFYPKSRLFFIQNKVDSAFLLPYPLEYNPGFYPYMVSLHERSKEKYLTRLGIESPERIKTKCVDIREIYRDIQKKQPYDYCKDEKCLAEASRQQTIWIFLRKIKQVLNDKKSYNCQIK
jgi:hypothetical protein